jgi:NAD(P)-dependent dehydrogenase (short-subunit alcohol dehydrogenase family)
VIVTDHAPDQGILARTALVTGSTAGLGRAIASTLARDGFVVIAHGRDEPRGDQVVKEIEAEGGRARFIAADLGDPADLNRLVTEAGDIDVLVDNAGFSVFGPSADLSVERFDALFAANVRAPYFLVAAFAPAMASRGAGSIINISSMVGTVGLPAAAAYGATKGALDSLTRAWAAEFSPSGVRVNSVAPGPVYTEGALPERTTAIQSFFAHDHPAGGRVLPRLAADSTPDQPLRPYGDHRGRRDPGAGAGRDLPRSVAPCQPARAHAERRGVRFRRRADLRVHVPPGAGRRSRPPRGHRLAA